MPSRTRAPGLFAGGAGAHLRGSTRRSGGVASRPLPRRRSTEVDPVGAVRDMRDARVLAGKGFSTRTGMSDPAVSGTASSRDRGTRRPDARVQIDAITPDPDALLERRGAVGPERLRDVLLERRELGPDPAGLADVGRWREAVGRAAGRRPRGGAGLDRPSPPSGRGASVCIQYRRLRLSCRARPGAARPPPRRRRRSGPNQWSFCGQFTMVMSLGANPASKPVLSRIRRKRPPGMPVFRGEQTSGQGSSVSGRTATSSPAVGPASQAARGAPALVPRRACRWYGPLQGGARSRSRR